MDVRPSILAALLGTLATVGAWVLPVAPDRGERARGERLTTHGHRAGEALSAEHYETTALEIARGIGGIDLPTHNASGMPFCDCARGHWVRGQSWGYCGDGRGGRGCASGPEPDPGWDWSERGCDPSRCPNEQAPPPAPIVITNELE